jgi:predicted transcriptional regulator
VSNTGNNQEELEKTSNEEAAERARFMAKVDEGLAQADAGLTISHEEVMRRMSKYLQKLPERSELP